MKNLMRPCEKRQRRRTAKARRGFAAALLSLTAGLLACNSISGLGNFDMTRAGSDDDDGAVQGEPTTPSDADADVPNDGLSPTDDADGAAPSDLPDATTDAMPTSDASSPAGPKRVFVTEAKVKGAFGGLEAADTMCAQAANNGGLGGTWVAWLSTSSVNAFDRLTTDGPYQLLDGTVIANDKAQLASGSILAPILLTENNAPVSEGENWVWTGTTPSGLRSQYTCSDWSTIDPLVFGVVGNFALSTKKWTEQGSPGFGFAAYGCQTWGHIYCFEQ